jgi:hypothetical protein
MEISEAVWDRYVKRLRAASDKAGSLMLAYLNSHDVFTAEGRRAAIEFAYALALKYGEATSALAAEMYDALAELSGVRLPPAEPAATATYGETAKVVNGTLREDLPPERCSQAVGRLVKQAGADTTLKNAMRDGSQFAWVPKGDTCPFCLMLASRGWQHASKKALKNGHAEHIHANCDCQYAVRFNERTNVAGYKPEKYLRADQDAPGSSWEDKINAQRRAQYAENASTIREQKRINYAERKLAQETNGQPL